MRRHPSPDRSRLAPSQPARCSRAAIAEGRPESWDPVEEQRLTGWETKQQLAHRLDNGGEEAAAALLRRIGGLGETARELAYRLYTTCERKGWAQDALAYNSLVVGWPDIARRVAGTPEAEAQQVLEV